MIFDRFYIFSAVDDNTGKLFFIWVSDRWSVSPSRPPSAAASVWGENDCISFICVIIPSVKEYYLIIQKHSQKLLFLVIFVVLKLERKVSPEQAGLAVGAGS